MYYMKIVNQDSIKFFNYVCFLNLISHSLLCWNYVEYVYNLITRLLLLTESGGAPAWLEWFSFRIGLDAPDERGLSKLVSLFCLIKG